MSDAYRLIGGNASPYSVKMRAILRYRRLPFIWERIGKRHNSEIADIRPPTMPYLVYPDGSIRNDSTLLVYDLEQRHSERSVLTGDSACDFLIHLIEDGADEWGTRIMAFSRWNNEEDQEFCSRWIADEMLFDQSVEKREAAALAFRERQTGRRPLLGASPNSRDILGHSFRVVLGCLNDLIETQEYLFGSRPSLADFGWFGQLYQMTIDPTGSAFMRREFPRVFSWLLRLDDLSGSTGEWNAIDAPLAKGTASLLRFVCATHLPLLSTNARAAAAGDAMCRFEVDGMLFEQTTNKYHVKCLAWLREEYGRLDADSRRRVGAALEASGCELAFAEVFAK